MVFASLLSDAAHRFQKLPVIVSPRGTASYSELNQAVEQCLKELRARGCRPGDAVVARVDSGLNFLTVFLAAVRAGYVFVPFAPTVSTEHIENVATEFDAAVIAEESADGKLTIFANSKRGDRHDYRDLFRDGGFIRYTSGTTGNSKGVFVSPRSAEARVLSAQAGLELHPELRIVWPLQMALHFVAVLPIVLMQGGAFCLAGDGSAESLRCAVEENSADTIYGSPLHYQLLSSGRSPRHSLSRALSTTAPLPASTASRFESTWGIRIDQVYGIFELGIVSAQNETNRRGVGKTMPGVKLSIRDENGNTNTGQAGTAGRVFISTPGALDAYLNPLRTRAEILNADWFETGDIGALAADGELLLCGRATSVINVGGAKVYPEQVEEALLSVPGVIAARAHGKKHAELGHVVCAEVILDDGAVLDEAALRRACRTQLDRYAVPQYISQVTHIPLSENGKIRRVSNGHSDSSTERGGPAAA